MGKRISELCKVLFVVCLYVGLGLFFKPDEAFAKEYDIDKDTLPYTAEQIYAQLFDINNKIEINVDMSTTELALMQKDYEKYENMGSKSPINRMADLYITIHTGKDTNTYKICQVGVRMKGNTSRCSFYSASKGVYNFVHLKFDFQETFSDEEYYGSAAIDWSGDKAGKTARKERTFATLKKLDSKWNRNYDTTYIREYYTYEMYRGYGLIAPHTNIASYDFAGNHMGVYAIYEPIDEIFLDKYLTDEAKGGDLYKCGWDKSSPADMTKTDSIGKEDEDKCLFYCYDIKTNKKTTDHSALKNLITNLSSGNVSKALIDKYVDVPTFLKFAAVSYFTGNPDDVRNNYNNYYVYFRKDNNKAIFIPYDMDRCLGVTYGWNPSGNGMTDVSPFEVTAAGASNMQANPVFRYTVCQGGYYIDEYKKELISFSKTKWLQATNFNTIYSIAKNNYSSDVKPSKNMENANSGAFVFDNVSSGSFNSNDSNISFSKYVNAILATCRKYTGASSEELSATQYYVRGDFNNWNVKAENRMEYDSKTKTYSYQLVMTDAGGFKVNNGLDGNEGEWFGYTEVKSKPATLNMGTDQDGNIRVPRGVYIIHFKPANPEGQKIWITLRQQTITAKKLSISKGYGTTFDISSLGISIKKGNGKLSYSTTDSKVLTYDKNTKKFKAVGVGQAYIKVTAGATSQFEKTTIQIKVNVVKGTQKITTSRTTYSVSLKDKKTSLKTKVLGKAKVTYSTSDKSIAKVTQSGTIVPYKCGKTVITIKTAATSKYKNGTKKITVVVTPKKNTITSCSSKDGNVTIKWNKDKAATGYQIKYSLKRSMKNAKSVLINPGKTNTKKLTSLTKGRTYYITVSPYIKIGGKKYYSTPSNIKKVIVR